MKIGGLIILIFTFLPTALRAQVFPDLNFTHITTREGLSSDITTCVTEDKQGFIWIGTVNGLNRWDGYRVKQYYHDPNDRNSLPSNSVNTLFSDGKGRLWISTPQGISCFLPDSNKFINYSINEAPPYHLGLDGEPRVYEDKQGEIWIVLYEAGVYHLDSHMRLEQPVVDSTHLFFLGRRRWGYSAIIADKEGREWAYMGNRIYRLDHRTKKISRVYDFSSQLGDKAITDIYIDDRGRCWVTTWAKGLWRFFPEDGRLEAFGILPDGICSMLREWEYNGKKWMVMTDLNSGLYLADPDNRQNRRYFPEGVNGLSIQGLHYYKGCIDHNGQLWVCSDRGINMTGAFRKMFDVYTLNNPGDDGTNPTPSDIFFGFVQTDSLYWFNKRFAGTYVVDQDMRLNKFYGSVFPLHRRVMNPTSSCYSFFRQGDELWMSTDSGLVEYGLKDHSSRLYFPSAFCKTADCRTIVPGDGNEIWIRSFSNGVFVFDTGKRKFVRWYSNRDSSIAGLPFNLNWMLRTRDGNIFVTAENTLLQFDRQRGRFIRHKIGVEHDGRWSEAGSLFGADEDESGRLWICGLGGVYVYNTSTRRVDSFFSEKGRMGEAYRICFDKYWNTWVNGLSGIWCYLKQKGKWIQFTPSDGLPGPDFEGFLARDSHQDIWCGLQNAVVRFHPDHLAMPSTNAPVIITEAVASGNSLHFPLNNSSVKQLIINPEGNYFTVDFAVLNYQNAPENGYYYRLTPLMKEFEQNDNGHLNFSGLASGTYRLEVKGGDRSGNLLPSTDRLDITVKQFFWQKTWVKLSLVAAIIAIISLIAARRVHHIRKEAAFRQKITESEMMALRAQMNPHFIFNCLNSIDNLIQNDQKERATRYLAKFAKLIRAILENSKKEIIPCWKDLEALKLYLEMEALRLDKQFSYSFSVEDEIMKGDYKVPPMILQPYVENAIHHGLMNKVEGDKQLNISGRIEEGYIRFTVEDNGVGRARAAAYKKRNRPLYQSMGMQITANRIDYFNAYKSNAISITDLFTAEGRPSGTRVEVWLNHQN